MRKLVTCAIEADEAITSAGVKLKAGVCQQLLAMEGEGQAANVDISAVGVGSQNAGHCPSLCLHQLKFIQLLSQTGNAC